MGEQVFDVCPCVELPVDDPEPEDMRNGDMLPTEDCLDNSDDALLFPDTVGNPIRSINGCPNASQSFSTSAWWRTKKRLSSQNWLAKRQH